MADLIAEWIERNVANAPPFTDEQVAQLWVVLAPLRELWAAKRRTAWTDERMAA